MYISIHSCLRIPTQYNRGPSGPLNNHNHYSFFSSLYISDNACIYPRCRPFIPFSSSRNCINALPYSESLVAKIYSEGSLLLSIPSVPPSSSYGLHQVRRIWSESSRPPATQSLPRYHNSHIFNRTFYISRLLKLASIYLRKIQSTSQVRCCFAWADKSFSLVWSSCLSWLYGNSS